MNNRSCLSRGLLLRSSHARPHWGLIGARWSEYTLSAGTALYAHTHQNTTGGGSLKLGCATESHRYVMFWWTRGRHGQHNITGGSRSKPLKRCPATDEGTARAASRPRRVLLVLQTRHIHGIPAHHPSRRARCRSGLVTKTLCLARSVPHASPAAKSNRAAPSRGGTCSSGPLAVHDQRPCCGNGPRVLQQGRQKSQIHKGYQKKTQRPCNRQDSTAQQQLPLAATGTTRPAARPKVAPLIHVIIF